MPHNNIQNTSYVDQPVTASAPSLSELPPSIPYSRSHETPEVDYCTEEEPQPPPPPIQYRALTPAFDSQSLPSPSIPSISSPIHVPDGEPIFDYNALQHHAHIYHSQPFIQAPIPPTNAPYPTHQPLPPHLIVSAPPIPIPHPSVPPPPPLLLSPSPPQSLLVPRHHPPSYQPSQQQQQLTSREINLKELVEQTSTSVELPELPTSNPVRSSSTQTAEPVLFHHVQHSRQPQFAPTPTPVILPRHEPASQSGAIPDADEKRALYLLFVLGFIFYPLWFVAFIVWRRKRNATLRTLAVTCLILFIITIATHVLVGGGIIVYRVIQRITRDRDD